MYGKDAFTNFLLIEQFSYDLGMKTHEQNTTNGNRVIWLLYWMDTNACGFWLVKWTLGWKNFMPENSLEISQYFALTSYCNTIGQLNNAFSILGFAFGWQNEESMFLSFIHWLIKQMTNSYQNHFSRSYENHSNCLRKNAVYFFILESFKLY